MINPMSSSDRILRPDGVIHHAPAKPVQTGAKDQFSPDQTSVLQSALERQPEVRPEVVERARALAADPDYPSAQIMRKVSEVILKSPDPLDQPE